MVEAFLVDALSIDTQKGNSQVVGYTGKGNILWLPINKAEYKANFKGGEQGRMPESRASRHQMEYERINHSPGGSQHQGGASNRISSNRVSSNRVAIIYSRFIPLILLLLVTPSLLASELSVDSQFESANIAPHSVYYEDLSGSEIISGITGLSDISWRKTEDDTLSFGITESSYWFRFNLTSRISTNLLLAIDNPGFDSVEMYVVNNSPASYSKSYSKSGYRTPHQVSALIHPTPLLPITLNSGDDLTLYLKASNSGIFNLPLKLWQTESFYQEYADQHLARGTFLGAWLAVLLFNIGFYALTRHKLLASFSMLILLFGIHQTSSLGLTNQPWWLGYPDRINAVSILSFSLGLILLCDFANRLLNLKVYHKAGEMTLRVLATLCFLLIPAYMLFTHGSVIFLLACLSIPVAGAVLLLGIIHGLQGNRTALYASAGWCLFLIGMISKALFTLEFIPAYLIIGEINSIGFILLSGLLSVVVIREVQKSNKKYQPGLVTSQSDNSRVRKNSTADVRNLVSDRTKELESALEELSQVNDTLREYNTIDSLTRVKNRHYFDTNYEQEWRRAVRGKYALSMLLIDVDHFKAINDTYGHLAGDECLKKVASSISSVIKRPGDILARYGGEEFIIVLPYIANKNACSLAQEIRERVKTMTLNLDGQEIHVTISIGVSSTTPEEKNNCKDLISSADIALYQAKNDGRDQIHNAGEITAGNSHAIN